MSTLEEDLQVVERKLMQVKLDYEQYFCGNRPREPVQARSEIQKTVTLLQQTPIKNTALRFKFNTLNSRFQAFKRRWDSTLREIENGTYRRHVFKANLHERERADTGAPAAAASTAGPADLFDAYKTAAQACGQSVKGLTAEKLGAVIQKQEAQLKQKLGVDRVNFRVVVQDGKVKLKASPVRPA